MILVFLLLLLVMQKGNQEMGEKPLSRIGIMGGKVLPVGDQNFFLGYLFLWVCDCCWIEDGVGAWKEMNGWSFYCCKKPGKAYNGQLSLRCTNNALFNFSHPFLIIALTLQDQISTSHPKLWGLISLHIMYYNKYLQYNWFNQ